MKNTEDILATLTGRVAIVGNSKPYREFGRLIDTYDHVIRINNYRIDGFERFVGSKTSFRCTSGWEDIEKRPGVTEFSPFTDTAKESAHLAAYREKANGDICTARNDIHIEIPTVQKPSTGLALIALARLVGLDVDLFCFDGFQTPHYWEEKSAATTHSNEIATILSLPNAHFFGESYNYKQLYDFCHKHHQEYNENAGLQLLRHLNITFPGKTILEFGAGNGDLSAFLEKQGSTVTAVEVSSEAFSKIKCTNKINGDVFSLCNLPAGTDLFLSVDVLEHLTVNDIQIVLREAARICNSIFISVSTRPSGLLGPNGENLHLTVRTRAWWLLEIGKHFEISKVQDGNGVGQLVVTALTKPKPTGVRNNSMFTKPQYIARSTPDYFADQTGDVIWQPNVYKLAEKIQAKFGCSRIIDVGCGTARKLMKLAPHVRKIGIDYGENIEFCQSTYNHSVWLVDDFESQTPIPIPRGSSTGSLVICSDVIEHMIKPQALLSKLQILMQDAWFCILTTPERDLTWGSDHNGPPPNKCHTREWTLEELSQMVESAGFIIGAAGLTQSHDRSSHRHTSCLILINPIIKQAYPEVCEYLKELIARGRLIEKLKQIFKFK